MEHKLAIRTQQWQCVMADYFFLYLPSTCIPENWANSYFICVSTSRMHLLQKPERREDTLMFARYQRSQTHWCSWVLPRTAHTEWVTSRMYRRWQTFLSWSCSRCPLNQILRPAFAYNPAIHHCPRTGSRSPSNQWEERVEERGRCSACTLGALSYTVTEGGSMQTLKVFTTVRKWIGDKVN